MFDPTPFLIANDLLKELVGTAFDDNYPPYNLVKVDDNHYRIDMAVAGFTEDEIEVEKKGDILTIKGQKKEKADENEKFLHRGLAFRTFKKTFTLSNYIDVEKAVLENGILRIYLVKELPEHLKPKKISITK